MFFNVIPLGRLPLTVIPVSGSAVVLLNVTVYVAGTPARTGGGTDTATIPFGDVTVSASAAGAEITAAESVSIVPRVATPGRCHRDFRVNDRVTTSRLLGGLFAGN
jgi:hypothetical protein